MLKWLTPIFEEDEINKNYRRKMAAKTVIYFSFAIMIFFTIFNFIDGKTNLFYLDALILAVITFAFFMFRKKSIYLVANILLFVITVGLIFLIYENQARDSVALWSIVLLFYLMSLHGHKRGLFLSGLFFIILFSILSNWIGESITYQGYVRFMIVCVVLSIVSFSYEYSTHKTLVKLDDMKNSLEKLTRIDPLTKLYNRRYFDEVFLNEIKIARRNDEFLVFSMIDIDYFKNYNDTYGHLAGDEVLRIISQSFRDTLQRPDDKIFRLGGEEFGILFQTKNRDDALNIINEICKKVEGLKIAHSDNGASPYVTVSIGVFIGKPCETCDYDNIYKAGDDALYDAKFKGRNRVEIHINK